MGKPLRRHEPMPVEASHRRFYRIYGVEPSAREREGAPLAGKEPSAGVREGMPLARKSSAGERTAAPLAGEGASAGERTAAPFAGKSASAGERERALPPPTDSPSANVSVDSSFVVMESPPSLERNADFVARQRLFAAAGLPVPEIIAMDLDAGFFLLSDLGERSLEDAYGGPDRDLALELAVAHLVRLQGVAPADVPAYEESRFRDELHLFVEWFLGGLLQQTPAAALAPVFEALVANALAQPQCLIHRDYHCRNLLLDHQGRFGIVDFQDALVGPITYDLACLLWDCYYRFNVAERRRWLRRYREQAGFPNGGEGASSESSPALLPPAMKGPDQPSASASIPPSTMQSGGQPWAGARRSHSECGWDEATLTRALDLTALQRQFKAVGIFARLWLRDGKPTHLRYIAPVLDAMQEIVALYQETRPLSPWLKCLAADADKAVQTARATEQVP